MIVNKFTTINSVQVQYKRTIEKRILLWYNKKYYRRNSYAKRSKRQIIFYFDSLKSMVEDVQENFNFTILDQYNTV